MWTFFLTIKRGFTMKAGYHIFVKTNDYGHRREDVEIHFTSSADAYLMADIVSHFTADNFGDKFHHRSVIGNLVDELLKAHPEASPRMHEWLGGLGEDGVYPTDAFMSIIGYDSEHDYDFDKDDGIEYYRFVESVDVRYVPEEPVNLYPNIQKSGIKFEKK